MKRLSGALSSLEEALRQSGVSQRPETHLTALAGLYIARGVNLPGTNAWRWGKLADSARGLQDVDRLSAKLGLSPTLRNLFYVITFAADLGRLVIAREHQDGNMGRTQAAHGAASAELLQAAGILGSYGSLGDAIKVAVTRHSDIKTPTLDDLGGDETAWALTALLRDLDMLAIISGKAFLYVWDPAERARQLVANKLTADLTASEEILGQFERGEAIDRLKCKTLLEWLLQFMAWEANFSFEETWAMAVESGGYQHVLRYLDERMLDGAAITRLGRIRVRAREMGIS